MVMTKAMQETVVGEGLAVGCLALGVTAVSADRQAAESAFRHAWRNWSHADRFPAVHATLARTDLLPIARRSTRRRTATVAEWETGRFHRPVLVDGVTVEEAGEVLAESGGVPVDAWISLAKAFVDKLGQDKVQRAE